MLQPRLPVLRVLDFVQKQILRSRPRRLDFAPPDVARFPALRLGYRALKEGGTSPATLNAANEVAVAAFLARRLPFLAITAVIEAVMNQSPARPLATLDDVLDADSAARRNAALQIETMAARV